MDLHAAATTSLFTIPGVFTCDVLCVKVNEIVTKCVYSVYSTMHNGKSYFNLGNIMTFASNSTF